MKIIFSKKGFDTQNGKWPSPILPDGSMYSIPIPASEGNFRYGQLEYKLNGLTRIMNDVTGNSIKSGKKVYIDFDYAHTHFTAHNDPFWIEEQYLKGYVLGPLWSAQGHLRNYKVGRGDLFLFYGIFQEVEEVDGKWRYQPESRMRYVFFGWLQIGEIVDLHDMQRRSDLLQQVPGIKSHPHVYKDYKINNMLYIPMQGDLMIGGKSTGKDCSGRFSYHNKRCLSSPFNNNTLNPWLLPRCFSSKEAFSKKTVIQQVNDQSIEITFLAKFNQEVVFDIDKLNDMGKAQTYEFLYNLMD